MEANSKRVIACYFELAKGIHSIKGGCFQQMHTPDFTRRFVRYAHCSLSKAGDAGVRLQN
jgi:hypothetical protein